MSDSPALQAYLDGLDQLEAARAAAGGELPEEKEDELLDQLDTLWHALSHEDHERLKETRRG